jgi:hypothetical protein
MQHRKCATAQRDRRLPSDELAEPLCTEISDLAGERLCTFEGCEKKRGRVRRFMARLAGRNT